MFSAILNTPGYLPEMDSIPLFDTARGAWGYLLDEYMRHCDQSEVDYDSNAQAAFESAMRHQTPTDTIYAADSDDDLGTAYTVTSIPNPWQNPAPTELPECIQCSHCGKDWARTDLAEAIEHTRYTHAFPSDLLATFYTIIDTKGI